MTTPLLPCAPHVRLAAEVLFSQIDSARQRAQTLVGDTFAQQLLHSLKGLFVEERDVQHAPLQGLRDCMRKQAAVATATDEPLPYIRAVGIIDGVLPADFTTLTLRIVDPADEPLPVATLNVLE